MNVTLRPGVGLHVPRPRLHLRLAVVVVTTQLLDAVLDVPPTAGELAGEVDRLAGHGLPAAREPVERPLGERGLRAGLPHRIDRIGDGAGALLRDDDRGLDLGDRAGLLDRGGLPEPVDGVAISSWWPLAGSMVVELMRGSPRGGGSRCRQGGTAVRTVRRVAGPHVALDALAVDVDGAAVEHVRPILMR
jgi:hypothetical protein